MNERVRPTKTGLFMTELLICVGVFSLCAAVCVGLFVKSEVMSRDSADLNQAVIAARNVSECFKAAGGDLERTAELAGGQLRDGREVVLYFDRDWNPISAVPGNEDFYYLTLVHLDKPRYSEKDRYLVYGNVEVSQGFSQEGLPDDTALVDELILSWEIAALEVRP